MTDSEIKRFKQFAAHMALFGLLETLCDPRNHNLFIEAHRIIFNADSTELRTIAALLETDAGTIQKTAFAYLAERDFPVNPVAKH